MFPKQVADLFFRKNWFGKQSLKIWNLVPSCLLWTLWKDHNSCNSKDKESSMAQLESLIIRTRIGLMRVVLQIAITFLTSKNHFSFFV